MIITRKNIPMLKQALDEWIKAHPELAGLPKVVQDYDEDIIILLTVDQLQGCHVTCGRYDKTCFDEEVINYLRDHGVKEILVNISGDTLGEFGDDEAIPISGGAIPIPFGEYTSTLSDMIHDRYGSFRDDDSPFEGWSTWESE